MAAPLAVRLSIIISGTVVTEMFSSLDLVVAYILELVIGFSTLDLVNTVLLTSIMLVVVLSNFHSLALEAMLKHEAVEVLVEIEAMRKSGIQ